MTERLAGRRWSASEAAYAGFDEVSVNEEVSGRSPPIEDRRSDPDFRRRLQTSIEPNRAILERFAQ